MLDTHERGYKMRLLWTQSCILEDPSFICPAYLFGCWWSTLAEETGKSSPPPLRSLCIRLISRIVAFSPSKTKYGCWVKCSVKGNVPFGRLRSLVLWSKRFEALATLLPNCARIGLHGMDYALLFGVVKIAKAFREAVDVEHDEIGEQRDYDDDIDKRSS